MGSKTTLEFFGMTTFRLKAKGLTIFHDTWLARPALMPRYLDLDSVTECDYIFISHAHFDHLPGSDILAKRTGATIIANCEAISCLREAGVPESQLLRVTGGERVPLFTRDILEQAAKGTIDLAAGPPGAPPKPDPKYAAAAVHVWPSLHALLPGLGGKHSIPEVFDTATCYTGCETDFVCTSDISRLMKYGLFRLKETVPPSELSPAELSFAEYVSDRKTNVMSHCDGGQMMYNFIIGDLVVLFNTHTGAYQGLVQNMEPKPKFAILGSGGRPNLNGRPFDGTPAEFLTQQVQWLGQPEKVFFSLHDKNVIKPYRTDITAAQKKIEQETSSRTIDTEPGKMYVLSE